jgi:ankyrin repeat protein
VGLKQILGIWCGAALLSVASFGASSSAVADAAMNKDKETLRSLVAQKADVNSPQADGATALHWAARWDDLDMAGLLTRAGANAKAANRDGATPLFLACLNGNAAMIETLLRAGADPNAPLLSHGETALMMAARSGHVDAVKALLDHGAKVNATESLRETTALMWAAEQGHAAVIKLLVERGADLRAQSKIVTPLVRQGLGFAAGAAVYGGRTDGKYAITRGNVRGGLTALIYAVREGCLDCVRNLVVAGADVSQTSVEGSSPLLVAVQNGAYDIALYLMDRGANPNLANEKGWTPLYLAVKNRNQETTAIPGPNTEGVMDFIKTLLDRGADPNVRINVETEVHQGMSSMWLKEAGATPLLRAALCGDLPVVRLLLAHHADPLIPTFDHTTPLMVASGVGWADGMIREYSEDQTFEVVKLLLEMGSDVNAVNDHGITPLHGAAFKGANKGVQLLVDRGAKLDAQDHGEDYGFGASSAKMTPLNWAEGVPIGMSSAIFHKETVALLARLMTERGIPVVSNVFRGKRSEDYVFGNGIGDATPAPAK